MLLCDLFIKHQPFHNADREWPKSTRARRQFQVEHKNGEDVIFAQQSSDAYDLYSSSLRHRQKYSDIGIGQPWLDMNFQLV